MNIHSMKFEPVNTIPELTEMYDGIKKHLDTVTGVYGDFTTDAILTSVLTNTSMLWVTKDNDEVIGVTVIEVQDFPTARKMCIHLCGGERIKEWVDVGISTLEDFARSLDCEYVYMAGRPGWLKLLDGYKQTQVILEKGL